MNKIKGIFDDLQVEVQEDSKGPEEASSKLDLFIAFTPRSGSSWLTNVLTEIKALGVPEEYFNPSLLPGFLKAFPSSSPQNYIQTLRKKKKSDLEVFSFEITWFQFKLWQELGIENALCNNRIYVWLRRRDLVSQAVSLYKAVESGYFHSVQPNSKDVSEKSKKVSYDKEKIKEWYNHILVQELGFNQYLKENRIASLNIFYEDMMASKAKTIQDIIEFINRINQPTKTITLQDKMIENIVNTVKHKKIGARENEAMACQFNGEMHEYVNMCQSKRGLWGDQ